MDAPNLSDLLAALGATAEPLFDYYGRELLSDDEVQGAPWSMVGFPAELTGMALRVVGQTGEGMLVVAPADDHSCRFRVWPESVSLVRRDGAALTVQSDAWWASVLAAQGLCHSAPLITIGGSELGGVPC